MSRWENFTQDELDAIQSALSETLTFDPVKSALFDEIQDEFGNRLAKREADAIRATIDARWGFDL